MTKANFVVMDRSSYFGRHIKGYEIFEPLGKGSFGTVYLAKLKKTGHEVAIKIINKERMKSNGMLQRVYREVEIHRGLDHPSILKLYDYFEDSSFVYLILELCHEGTLHSYMKRSGTRFSEDEARCILQQIVEGFIYLQSKNIMHRDVKLDNILLTKDRNIKIADFGLAAWANENHKTMCGTPNYIAPEVATHCSQGLEVDVYSLGCLLYAILVGRPPFEDGVTRATITRSVMLEVNIPSHISPEASDLIKSLLKKNPKDRIKLRAVLNHPFLKKTCLKKANSKLSIHRSVDSGMGSIGSSAMNSAVSGRRTCELDVRSRSVEYDSASRNCTPHRNRANTWSSDTNLGYLSMPRSAAQPVCGKSPPVRLEVFSNTRRKIQSFKPKFQVLPSPSLGFASDSSIPASNRFPATVESFCDRGVTEGQRGCQQISSPNSNKCGHTTDFQRPDCDDVFAEKEISQDYQHTEASCQCSSNHSQGSSCHGCATDRGSCCSQCNEMASCGREQCPRNRVMCCTTNRESSHCRSPSHSCHGERVDLHCCAQNSKPSCCSHYGSCDAAHCIHGDSCCCKRSSNNSRGSSPVRECHIQHSSQSATSGPYQDCQKVDTVNSSVPPKSLKDFTPPLNTLRLAPIRQKANNAVVSILSNGEVSVEILKKHNSKVKVVDVCRISEDGMRIITYRPDRHGVPVGDEPPPIPKKGADDIYGYESLPRRHWKKYMYAARFVKLVQAKTPKLTFYSSLAKSMMMESGIDFEMSFYKGGKIFKSAASTKIIDLSEKVYYVENENDVHKLGEDVISMWEHFLITEKRCQTLIATLESFERDSSESFFPAHIGRRPSSLTFLNNSNKENVSPVSPMNSVPGISNLASYDGTVVSNSSRGSSCNRVQPTQKLKVEKTQPRTEHSESTIPLHQFYSQSSSERAVSKPTVVKKVYIQGIGRASELSTHDILIQFEDETQLTVTESSYIYFIDKSGREERYNQDSKLPHKVQVLLQNVVPAVIKELAKCKELPNG